MPVSRDAGTGPGDRGGANVSMPATLASPGQRPGDGPPPDRGCSVWPSCVTCPWSTCVAELAPKEHQQFVQAFKLVRRYLAAPSTTIDT